MVIIVAVLAVLLVIQYVSFRIQLNNEYWKGSTDGWKDCEKMVNDRIKQYYPEKRFKLMEELVQ